LNVKSSDKGYRKRDGDSCPIRDVDDEHVSFLHHVYDWLCKWENLSQSPRQGCLTTDTLTALKHTVITFVQLIPYLLHT